MGIKIDRNLAGAEEIVSAERNFSPDYIGHHCNESCKGSFEFLLAKTRSGLVTEQTCSSTELLSGLYNIVQYGNKTRAVIRKTD